MLKAREEQKELTQESGGAESSLNEEDILNIVKETEKDVKEKKKGSYAICLNASLRKRVICYSLV